jgi:GH25 family lysozyme M1 (1,4-beta-N-acetylmuramidase)
MNPVHLPDVSEYQPDVDWADVVAKNGGAAIIRALYGTSHVDKAWYGGARRTDAHAKGVRALGIYQYLVASQDPVVQAEAFVALVGTLHQGEFAILDLEEGDGDQSARAEAWLTHVDEKLTYPGYTGAWLYSDAAFFEAHGLMPFANSKRHTWVAAYGPNPPAVPHVLWQHTSGEVWPGIPNRPAPAPAGCDCSIFNGDVNGLLSRIHG